ncbi:MAG: hypothetical protein IPK76_14460 [Lewinellaceae bacterium]|nr:hypothetical protein [Lewinellaceae bacterium]
MGWIERLAPENIPTIPVTADVFQSPDGLPGRTGQVKRYLLMGHRRRVPAPDGLINELAF